MAILARRTAEWNVVLVVSSVLAMLMESGANFEGFEVKAVGTTRLDDHPEKCGSAGPDAIGESGDSGAAS